MKTMSQWFCAAGACVMLAGTAQAGEVYGGVGLPGLMLGYAQPLNERITLRGDLATLGSRDYNTTRDGVAYAGSVKAYRAGVFADWFAFSGGFRFTGGLTFNTLKADLSASGAGKKIQLGNANAEYTLTANDRLAMSIKFPSATPYLGIGYGHHGGKGLVFAWDVGASIGKPKVSISGEGAVLGAAATQTDIAAEQAKIQRDLNKIPIVPQISLAVGYRF
jgi:hypothetical protein